MPAVVSLSFKFSMVMQPDTRNILQDANPLSRAKERTAQLFLLFSDIVYEYVFVLRRISLTHPFLSYSFTWLPEPGQPESSATKQTVTMFSEVTLILKAADKGFNFTATLERR